jgi:riboflavin transporter FmnP
MDSKKISLIAVFAALAFILNMSPLKIPAPYAPFLIYQVWEVPIVTATMLFSLQIGVIISILNTIILLLAFPGALPTGPIYNLIAVLATLLGIFLVDKILVQRMNISNPIPKYTAYSIVGSLLRVFVMTVVNYVFLPYPPPFGFSMPIDVVVGYLPLIGFFNATLALYTVFIGAIIAKFAEEQYPALKEIK